MASSEELAAKKPKKVYKVKFADSWIKRFPIGRVNDNPHAFFCIPRKNSVSCAHMGINDVKEHCKAKRGSNQNGKENFIFIQQQR